MAKPSISKVRQRALANGYRSGLEERIAKELEAKGVHVTFEGVKINYTPPLKMREYTPDFPLPNGIIIETKGRFLTEDRQKHKVIKDEHPDLDLRFVFSRAASTISKTSKTTYSMWADKYGFKWADKSIPDTWLKEKPCNRRLAAIERARVKSPKK